MKIFRVVATVLLLVFAFQPHEAKAFAVDVSSYGEMAAVVGAQGKRKVTLVVSDVQSVDSDLVIPMNIKLSVVSGGQITVAAGKTFTINGQFECKPVQCFAGKGLVKFGIDTPVDLIPEWWGAVGDGIANDAATIQAAIQATPPGGTINFGNKTYNIDSKVVGRKSIKIKGSATVKGSGYLSFEGSLEDTSHAISKPASVGSKSITVTSTKGISSGDLVILQNRVNYSFAPFRSYYQDGEFLEVSSVSSSTITFKNKLQTSYAGINTDKVYRVTPLSVTIGSGMKFSSTGDFALRLSYCKSVMLKDIHCTGGKSAAFALNKSFQCRIVGGRFENKHTPPTGENYGIVIVNCQDVTVSGSAIHGTRHGTSTGGDARDGSVPCRNIKFEDCLIGNDTSELQAADFHGNTVDSSYIRCTVSGPISLSGSNVSAVNCTAIAKGQSAPLQYTEIASGTIRFAGCSVSFAEISAANSAVAGTSSKYLAMINKDYSIVVEDLTMHANSNSKSVGIIYHAAIGTVRSFFKYDNITVLGTLRPGFRVLDCTVANPADHAIAPIAPDAIYLGNVRAEIKDTHKLITKSGAFRGTVFTIPKR